MPPKSVRTRWVPSRKLGGFVANFRDRLTRAAIIMRERQQDAMLIFSPASMHYLTGFYTFPGERLLVAFLFADGKATFLVPRINEEHVKKTSCITDVRTWPESSSPWPFVRDILSGLPKRARISVDDRLWARFLLELQRLVSPHTKFSCASEILRDLRMRKSQEELTVMRRAGRIADQAMAEAISECRPGRAESQIGHAIENAIKTKGAEGTCFDTIVASGPNSSLPHHATGERKLRKGDVVVLDFGPLYRRYCSDITRTIFLGKPTTTRIEVYRVVEEAQRKAVEAVRPGVTAGSIDRIAREHIERAGFGKEFFHRTGHGIGLEDHEDPYIVESNSTILEPGMVFSVEPGVYFAGNFGVRIEDIVAVTRRGHERLTRFPKGMTVR